MTEPERPAVGSVCWIDLTVTDADTVRDFYHAVVGWEVAPVDMGDYSDYSMAVPSTQAAVTGVCHARGVNADLPPQWLVYIVVEDLDTSAERCVMRGGSVIAGPRALGRGRYCVIRDPAGAVCALYQPQE